MPKFKTPRRVAATEEAPKPAKAVSLVEIPNPTIERQLRTAFAHHDARRAWALYKKTKRPEHAWDSYVAWREIAPPDVPLPRELLAFLDECAKQRATDPRSAAKHASAGRRQRDIAEWVLSEIRRCTWIGEAKPGFKTRIYGAAAKKFGTTLSEVRNIAHDFELSTLGAKFPISPKFKTA